MKYHSYQMPVLVVDFVVSGNFAKVIIVFTCLQIAEAGEDALPSWLYFNEELKALQGIAGTDDIGRQFLMEVTAISHFTNDTLSHAKDIFAVNVAEDNAHSQTSATPLKVIGFLIKARGIFTAS